MSSIDISSIMDKIESISDVASLYDESIAKSLIQIDDMSNYLSLTSAWKIKAKELKEPLKNIDKLIDSARKDNPFLDMSNCNTLDEGICPDFDDYKTGRYVVDNGLIYYTTKDNQMVTVSNTMMIITATIIVESGEEGVVELYYSVPTNNLNKTYEYRRDLIPASWISSASKITRLYDYYGIDATSVNAKALIAYLSEIQGRNANTIKRLRGIDHLGKYKGDLLPWQSNKVIYTGDKKLIANLKPKGDYEAWKEVVSKYSYISGVKLAIGSALGSLIMSIVSCQPFVCHLWGKSGSGKTVASMIAASMFGYPALQDDGLLQSANGTPNALMHHAATMYDLPCFFDETEAIKKKENLDALVMQLCEGRNRSRLKSGSESEKPKSWRCSFVTSGEAPICKNNSFAGVANRIIEVGFEDTTALSSDGPEITETIKENCGHFIMMFWEHLKASKILRDKYKSNRHTFSEMGKTPKQSNIGAVVLTAYQIAREIEPELNELTAEEVAEHLKGDADVDQNIKAYDYLIDTISANQSKFYRRVNEDYKDYIAPVGETWGRIEDDEIIIIKSVFDRILQESEYDPKGFLKWIVQRSMVGRTPQGKSTSTQRIGTARATCIRILPKKEQKQPKFNDFIEDIDNIL